MSTNLMWEPVTERGKVLSDKLKRILSDSYGPREHVLTKDDLSYLRGLRDCGVSGADTLIDGINQYDEVRIWWAA